MDIQFLIDLSVEENLAPERKFLAQWTENGEWQLRALQQLGMRPEHRLLDVGCGPLRLGIPAINYLKQAHYFGIDPFAPYIRIGTRLAEQFAPHREYTVIQDDGFSFSRFATEFDFGMAQSVFTHLSDMEISDCTAELKKVMRAGAQFVFTYITGAPVSGRLYGGWYPVRIGRIESDDYFEDVANNFGLTFEKLDIDHPTRQSVGVFRF